MKKLLILSLVLNAICILAIVRLVYITNQIHAVNEYRWDVQATLDTSFDNAIRNGGYDKPEKEF